MAVLHVMLCFQPRTSLHQTTKSRIFDHNDDHWGDNKGSYDRHSGFEHEPCHIFRDRWTHFDALCSLASTTNVLNGSKSWKHWHFQPRHFCYASFVYCYILYYRFEGLSPLPNIFSIFLNFWCHSRTEEYWQTCYDLEGKVYLYSVHKFSRIYDNIIIWVTDIVKRTKKIFQFQQWIMTSVMQNMWERK
jgi:hypothetical protein